MDASTTIDKELGSYIHQQARELALNRKAEADGQAAQMVARAEATVAQEHSDQELQIARSIAEQRHRRLAQAGLVARQTLASSREELVERLWHDVEQALRSQAQQEPSKRLYLLQQLTLDAVRQLGGGPLALHASAGDQPLLTAGVLAEWQQALNDGTALSLCPEPADIWGGVIVYRTDSNRLVDNSLNERLALAKSALRNEVYAVLERDLAAGTVEE